MHQTDETLNTLGPHSGDDSHGLKGGRLPPNLSGFSAVFHQMFSDYFAVFHQILMSAQIRNTINSDNRLLTSLQKSESAMPEIPHSPGVCSENHSALHLQHREEIYGILEIPEQTAGAELMAVVTQNVVVPAGPDHLSSPFGSFPASDSTSSAAGYIDARRGGAFHEPLRRAGDNPAVMLEGNYLIITNIDPGMLGKAEGKIAVDNRARNRPDKDRLRRSTAV